MYKKLKKKLIDKRRIIKNKLRLLREAKFAQEELFSPITKHLLSIENKLDNKNNAKTKNTPSPHKLESLSKQEEKEEEVEKEEEEPQEFHQQQQPEIIPRFKKKFIPSRSTVYSKDIYDTEEEEDEYNSPKNNEQEIFEQSFIDYLEQYDPLPRKYIGDMLENDKDFDQKYGVRHNPSVEKFYIGNSQLYIDGPDIIVQNKKYKGTQGLYELLFKKHPKNFSPNDQISYKDIVLKTNAHRRYYQAKKQVDGSKLPKYREIIAPLVEGKGLPTFMKYNDNPINYLYYDDPNEIIDRLRLLIASQEAGNTGHINEINEIISELREANIIE